MASTDHSARAVPRQARSRETYDRLIRTAGEILEEVGLEGLNTNLLAERSGVGVRALYRYFPNKFAVLIALAESFNTDDEVWLGDLSDIASAADWREWVRSTLGAYYRAASIRPGYAALRAASLVYPEVREMEAAANRTLEGRLAAGLAQSNVALPPEELATLCRVIVEASDRVLSLAVQEKGQQGDLLVAELSRLIIARLAEHLD